MTNYNPKNVQNANDYARQQEENRHQIDQMNQNHSNEISAAGFAQGSDDTRQPHIQIEDMGNSISNIQEATRHGGKSGLASDSHSMIAMTKGSADPSRLGHQTRATDYTSNIGNNTMQDGGHFGDRANTTAGGALSFMAPPPGSATPSMRTVDNRGQGQSQNILNYPYSYDQD